ncbi:MAG: GNAT family N-acetyltransferase [Ectothiorhodospiraceae bacterium]|nr:GNAT family N-acetyltransferase [Chromatiales bacterium]MCP5154912.1 GNAT family N-acetyltransferase [Ectothiorhodospiraceae bacterium]
MTAGLHDEQIPREIDPETGLPIGPPVADPSPAARPGRIVLEGRWCRLEPLDPVRHGDELYAAATPPDKAARHRYLPDAAPESRAAFQGWLERTAAAADPLAFAVIDLRSGRVEGRQTLMRITPEHRCIEIGNIYWGPAIARTPVSTEANYLFARHVFEDLGYRRHEWKCDALNAPSRAAALRFGFTYEGHFRRAVIIRGRSRDTAWFSMIEEEWPALKAAYEQWLAPDNFDSAGRQRTRLGVLTAAALGRG